MASILLVDDDQGVVGFLAAALDGPGQIIEKAYSEEEACRKVGEQNFDLVITDMWMESETSGLRVLEAAIRRHPETKVIVVTAYGTVLNAVDCLHAGAFDYVQKDGDGSAPIKELLKKAHRALAGSFFPSDALVAATLESVSDSLLRLRDDMARCADDGRVAEALSRIREELRKCGDDLNKTANVLRS